LLSRTFPDVGFGVKTEMFSQL